MWIPTSDPPIGARSGIVTTFQIASSSVTNALVDPSTPNLVLQTVNISVYPRNIKSQQTMAVSIKNKSRIVVQVFKKKSEGNEGDGPARSMYRREHPVNIIVYN